MNNGFDFLSLDTVPLNVQCSQLGSDNYYTEARKEALTFIRQLRRAFGEPPTGAYFGIGHCPHDFGTYLEVRVYFDPDNKEAVDYAYKIEANTPEEWDDIAKKEMAK
jgi:hypothetical protein